MGPAAWIPFILRYWRRARVVNQLSKKRLWLLYSARCLHSRAGTREHFYKPSYCLKSLVFITAKIKIVHHSLNILICLFFPGYMPNFQSLGLTRNNLLNLLINRMQFWLHFNVLLPNHINNRFNLEWFISCIDFVLCAVVYRCNKRCNCWNLLSGITSAINEYLNCCDQKYWYLGIWTTTMMMLMPMNVFNSSDEVQTDFTVFETCKV